VIPNIDPIAPSGHARLPSIACRTVILGGVEIPALGAGRGEERRL
jgi:hypothetical protein